MSKITCIFCGNEVQGNYQLHRDNFGIGPIVDLCDKCGESDELTLGVIWESIAIDQPNESIRFAERWYSLNDFERRHIIYSHKWNGLKCNKCGIESLNNISKLCYATCNEMQMIIGLGN